MDSAATGMCLQIFGCFELINCHLERRSTRPRNPGGPRARLEELGEVLAAPTHKKKSTVTAPTTGDRGRALATQAVRFPFSVFVHLFLIVLNHEAIEEKNPKPSPFSTSNSTICTYQLCPTFPAT